VEIFIVGNVNYPSLIFGKSEYIQNNLMKKNDNLELIYEITKEKMDHQQTRKNALENKASALTAFSGGMFALLMGARETILNYPFSSQILIIISILGFSVSVLQSMIVIWVKKYRNDPNIEKLAETYLEKSKEETLLQLISNSIGAWKHNETKIERNASVLRFAFLLQSAAFVLLGIAFGISIWGS